MQNIRVELNDRGKATVTLDRSEKHNAFDDVLLAELHQVLDDWQDNGAVRVAVIKAAGRNFSAGADLNWMRRMSEAGREENYQDALAMANFFYRLATFDKPTIALVQGAVMGGGVGLVAACDMAIASEQAYFALSEVRLGIIPAVISPYVIRAIGARLWQYYALTGNRFDAREALALGLVQKVVPLETLPVAGEELSDTLLQNGPAAMAAVKSRLSDYHAKDMQVLAKQTAHAIAEIRTSNEGREGVAAFLEKRQADWVKNNV